MGVVILALLGVMGVLLGGLWSLARPGARRRSQGLMRWRVALQGLALVVLLFLFWGR